MCLLRLYYGVSIFIYFNHDDYKILELHKAVWDMGY